MTQTSRVLEIPINYINELNNGKVISMNSPTGVKYVVGEKVRWTCFKAEGEAEVLTANDAEFVQRLTLRKL